MNIDKYLASGKRLSGKEPEEEPPLTEHEKKVNWIHANKCAHPACPHLGVLSHGTRGNMPFYCREHFWGQS